MVVNGPKTGDLAKLVRKPQELVFVWDDIYIYTNVVYMIEPNDMILEISWVLKMGKLAPVMADLLGAMALNIYINKPSKFGGLSSSVKSIFRK